MKCVLCNKPVTVKCIWGLFDYHTKDDMNEADLCNDCSNQLYDKCRGAINSLLMYWKNIKIE